jgi:hypothetical protein
MFAMLPRKLRVMVQTGHSAIVRAIVSRVGQERDLLTLIGQELWA